MVFSSITFVFFFLPMALLLAIGSWFVVKSFSNTLRATMALNASVLFASLCFYAWGEGLGVCILTATIVFSFLCSLGITVYEDRLLIKRAFFALGIALNLGFLVWFKYSNFGVEILQSFGFSPAWSEVLLPLGISFFVFQAISYLSDVYSGKIEASRDLLIYASYISFFPQLVAGPIVRFSEVSDLLKERTLSLDAFSDGAKRFSLGLSKKVLIANPAGQLADGIYSLPHDQIFVGNAWLGAMAYGIQIFFDFSGYSDMAIGLGRMIGLKLPENFNQPYSAKTLTDFWRRWHMTLSRWFRDYIYISLGGNRRGSARLVLNLSLVFLLCGFWHGASWNFILWGALHGLGLSIERSMGIKECNTCGWKWFPYRLLLVAFILVGWVLFRAETLDIAGRHIGAMFLLEGKFSLGSMPMAFHSFEAQCALLVGAVWSLSPLSFWQLGHNSQSNVWRIGRSALLLLSLWLSIGYICISTYNPFIYFRF
jgi:D-alanyl-lipoteichoic acid acyltransferase DltB (MBOAT superfamily)